MGPPQAVQRPHGDRVGAGPARRGGRIRRRRRARPGSRCAGPPMIPVPSCRPGVDRHRPHRHASRHERPVAAGAGRPQARSPRRRCLSLPWPSRRLGEMPLARRARPVALRQAPGARPLPVAHDGGRERFHHPGDNWATSSKASTGGTRNKPGGPAGLDEIWIVIYSIDSLDLWRFPQNYDGLCSWQNGRSPRSSTWRRCAQPSRPPRPGPIGPSISPTRPRPRPNAPRPMRPP